MEEDENVEEISPFIFENCSPESFINLEKDVNGETTEFFVLLLSSRFCATAF